MMVFEGEEVRRFRHSLRAKSDAIMVGSNTIRADDPHLTVRDAEGPNPLRVIPASQGDLPLQSNVFSDGLPTLVAVSASAPQANVAALEARGVAVERVGETVVDLRGLLARLHTLGIGSVMVEGGAKLLASLFRARLVDELIIQHLPVIFGGDEAPAMVGGAAIDDVLESVRLELVDVTRMGQHAIITYRPRHE